MTTQTQHLRSLLQRPGLIRSLVAHDVFTAQVMQSAGLELLFLGGFGTAASLLGLPDLGLLTMSEMADALRRMTARLEIPVIADGDTGHGNLRNVARTVDEFERAGAAGIILEDQQSPKRCGHFAGKQLISTEEMVAKLEVALQTRRDPDLVIVARTDARAVEGLESAIARGLCYLETGADVCFIEAPHNRDELARIPNDMGGLHMANVLFGGRTPLATAQELEQWGYKIMVCPIESLAVTGFAVRGLTEELLRTGHFADSSRSMLTFNQIQQLLGLGDAPSQHTPPA